MPQTPESILHRAQLYGDMETFQGRNQDQGDLGRLSCLQNSHPAAVLQESISILQTPGPQNHSPISLPPSPSFPYRCPAGKEGSWAGGGTFLQSSHTTQAEPSMPSCSPHRMQRFTPSPATFFLMVSRRSTRRLEQRQSSKDPPPTHTPRIRDLQCVRCRERPSTSKSLLLRIWQWLWNLSWRRLPGASTSGMSDPLHVRAPQQPSVLPALGSGLS